MITILCLLWSNLASADGPQFQAITRDDRQVSGHLTEAQPSGLRFLTVTSNGTAIRLDKLQRMELPLAPRRLPDRGWRRLQFVNGDVLHARLDAAAENDPGAAAPTGARVAKWMTGLGPTVVLPFSSLAQVTHPPGSRCLLYQDFETAATGWLNPAGETISLNREQARSGTSSVKFSAEQPNARLELVQSLKHGWIEFGFYVDPSIDAPAEVVATFLLNAAESSSEIQISLMGRDAWYEVAMPPTGNWQRQIIARRPGWHTLGVAVQAGAIRLSLDDFPLAEGRYSPASSPSVSGMKFAAAQPKSVAWIDDFSVTEAVADSTTTIMQREQDQLDLATGDQLFGRLVAIGLETITLEANSRQLPTPWRNIDRLQLAARPAAVRPVVGWIIQLELQPWSTLPENQAADRLCGALIAVQSDACVIDHVACGSLTIPWPQIRRIQPKYHGQLLTLEGRPQHLGNEVKSAFQASVPQGLKLKRTFDLAQVPVGVAFISISAADLEPAGQGTREHPWLKRLRTGELTSELWINERRISVLNQAVTGRGTTRQPQRLRIKLPADALRPGRNQVEIRLLPSRDEPAEYDDWELHELSLEIETPVDRD